LQWEQKKTTMKTKTNNFSPKVPLTPLNQALKYLALRSRSIKEMHEYLRKKQYSEEDIQDTIDKLLKLKFLNDDNFARSFIESKQRAGKSKKLIEFELKTKGITRNISEDVLDHSPDDFKTALQYMEKRIHQFDRFDSQTRQKKIISRLRSRGFDWEVISKVLKQLQQEGA